MCKKCLDKECFASSKLFFNMNDKLYKIKSTRNKNSCIIGINFVEIKYEKKIKETNNIIFIDINTITSWNAYRDIIKNNIKYK